jgi:osmotically-inducible protein OsmY
MDSPRGDVAMTTAALTANDVHLRDSVIRELDWDAEVDDSAIGVAARAGVVTLTGFTDSYAGKLAAERVVTRVRGVRAVANDIVVRARVEVTPTPVARDVRRRIVQSLHRNADLDARQVGVAVNDDVVTLTGTVASWSQRDAAERGAGSAPGIRRVDNQIRVVPPEPHEFAPPDEIC